MAPIALRGYLYEGHDPNAPTLLVFNGQNMLIADADPFYRSLAALGPTVIVWDYRGTGFSTGTPDPDRWRADALILYDNLAVLRPGHRVVVYGFSFGSAIAAYVATQRPVAALILTAPIASAAEELRVYATVLGKPYVNMTPSPDATSFLAVPSMVARSPAPLLVIHSRADVIVPVQQGREVFAASTAPSKRFVELPSTLHGQTPTSPASLQAVKQFLATLTTASSALSSPPPAN